MPTTAKRPRTTPPADTAPAPARPARGRAKNLVVVESPAKARTVENILGPDYRVIASVGHVRDLPSYGYGLEDFESFRPKYVVVKDKKRGIDKTDVIREIAIAAEQADRVFLSTDPDREGEAISWHIQQAAGIPDEKASRVVFHEITKPAIEEAFLHPGKLNMHLVDAQQTRRVLDRLIGFPLTWFVQGKVSKSASAGRVQSVALRLIVERERLIGDFNAQEYWTMHALLDKEGQPFEAELSRLPSAAKGTTLKPGNGEFRPAITSQADAMALAETFRASAFSVASVKKGERGRAPAPPFTTSTFQQAANNRLGMSAARAMGVAQELYEGITLPGAGPVGLITYMRTDSLNVSPIARGDARRFIAQRFGDDFVPAKERVYRTRAKGAQEAHEAIWPTDPARTPESVSASLSREQQRVYTLIWQRFLASQMADARYATVTVDIEAKRGTATTGTFRASAQQLLFAGHLAAYGVDASEPGDEELDGAVAALPDLKDGDALATRGIDPRQHFTEPPPRFTEATLVKALEEKGIGRPSTYATIVQTVLKRDYVSKQGRALVPQELGFLVNDLLVEHVNKYVDVGFTSEMEEELDEVADGNRDYLSVVRDFWGDFEREVEAAKTSAEKIQEDTDILCDVCGEANLVIKWGRNGKFLACPRFPACRNAKPLTQEGEPAPSTAPEPSSYACPICQAGTIRKVGPYGPYLDCNNREAGKCTFRSSVPVGIECPEEPGSGQLVEKKSRRGTFYACWNYPNCSYTTNSLEPEKLAKPRAAEDRAVANAKLLERSARGKAAFATRRAKATATRRAS
ncbi:MAG: type I DNA topoisomerase [Dehalococcoidia bacterium]